MTLTSMLARFGGGGASRNYGDLVLVAGVVVIISLMIMPLPTTVIDLLVALNMLIGLGLLLMAIYIPAPIAFSSFPSVLLLTTLFRLALSISITRAILLHADGGHIIDTFGHLVVGGSLIVGLVVFLIITVVQFIVIAKGAERVAEVAARFSLDAMPGKQLSIDSDLRSGLMDKDEARRRRRGLELESQLHGAMDGAMKFVKGDAIAGIVIIIINLLGGFGVGMFMHGMSLAESVRVFSVLTIGDGLVAQIPALLAAMSAGLIVTRSAGDEEAHNLGTVIGRQVTGRPRVLIVLGFIALGMGFVPGFPLPVFLLLGCTLVGVGAWRMREDVPLLRKLFRLPDDDSGFEAAAMDTDALKPPPALLLEVHSELFRRFGGGAVRALANAVVAELRNEYGVLLPTPTVRPAPRLQPKCYALHAYGVCIASGELEPETLYLPAPPRQLQSQPAESGAIVRVSTQLTVGIPGSWVAPERTTEDALEPMEVMRRHLRMMLERNLALFVGIQETSDLSNSMSRDYPDLVREMLRVVSPQRIAEILKRLVGEQVPIRHLRDVFEAITDAAGREKDIVLLVEQVRVALARHLSMRYANADHELHVLVARPELEDLLRSSVHKGPSGAQLAIEPEAAARLLRQIGECLQQAAAGTRLVLLSSMDVRRQLRLLTQAEFADLPVLSYQELTPDLRVVSEGQLTL